MAGAELLNELTTVALGQVELSDAALRRAVDHLASLGYEDAHDVVERVSGQRTGLFGEYAGLHGPRGWLGRTLAYDTRMAMSEQLVCEACDLPPGVYEGANRYSTDDEEVLTLWRDGKTWDVRVKFQSHGRALRRGRLLSYLIGEGVLELG